MAVNTTYDVSDSWILEYGADIQDAFDKRQSYLRPTIRQRSGVVGYSTRFQKGGTAAKPQVFTTSNRSEVPLVEVSHDYVDCTLYNRVVGVPASKFDDMKTNADLRALVKRQIINGARQVEDEVIAAAMNAGAIAGDRHIDKSSSGALDLAAYAALFSQAGTNDWLEPGMMWGALSHNAWNDLLAISEVKSSDYVPESQLPFSGSMIPMVLEFYSFRNFVVPHLPKNSGGTVRYSFFYHTNAFGYANQMEHQVVSFFNGPKHADQFNSSVVDGACTIDNKAIVRLDLLESAGEGVISAIA